MDRKKPSLMLMVILAVAFLTILAGCTPSAKDVSAYAQETIPCYCEKETATLLAYRGASAGAKGKIEYCRRSAPEFKIALFLQGLSKNHAYMLCLNGWPGRPGNDILKKYGRQGEGENQEGYYDFTNVTTDEQGIINKFVDVSLEPTKYEVKFLVKDIANKYRVVLHNDDIRFTIEKIKIGINNPPDDAEVGHTAIVKGDVSDPGLNIYVFVHPLLTDLWWCQRRPSPSGSNGLWRTLCYFGTETKGIGEYFDVVAVAACGSKLWKQGQVIKQEDMQQILKQYPHSAILCYKRTK